MGGSLPAAEVDYGVGGRGGDGKVAMQARRRITCLVAGALLWGAACADESGDDLAGASTADDSRSEAERQADEDDAAAMLLTIDDFPPGWEERPAPEGDEGSDSDDLQTDLADCLGVDRDEVDSDNPDAMSPTFRSSDDERVGVMVAFTPSTDAASDVLDRLADDDAVACYGDAVRSDLAEGLATVEAPDGVEVGDPTFERLSFPSVGDESVAFRATVPFSAGGVDVELYVDYAVVRVGRVGITAIFQSMFSPFDENEAAQLVQTVVDRAPEGEGS
jgi:hypothetical protein